MGLCRGVVKAGGADEFQFHHFALSEGHNSDYL